MFLGSLIGRILSTYGIAGPPGPLWPIEVDRAEAVAGRSFPEQYRAVLLRTGPFRLGDIRMAGVAPADDTYLPTLIVRGRAVGLSPHSTPIGITSDVLYCERTDGRIRAFDSAGQIVETWPDLPTFAEGYDLT